MNQKGQRLVFEVPQQAPKGTTNGSNMVAGVALESPVGLYVGKVCT